VRIAQVCPYSLSIPGGVQSQVLGLARTLLSRGHDVSVLAPCDGPPPAEFVIALGKSIPTSANGSVAPIAPDPLCALRTIRELRRGGFDVLHLHEPLCPGPTLTALLVTDRPKLGTFHRAGASLAYDRLRPVARWAARHLDMRCAVSEDARSTAAAALGGEYDVLFNGIELDCFAKADPWPTDRPTIMYLGRHEPRKGLAVLLDALADLPREVRLWVGGHGPQTRQLRARWGGDERIEWLGVLGDEEKAARLRGAHVLCAPSLGGESFGVVLLEAMAARTPIVASDIPGYRQVAHPGDALLVPPACPGELADALKRVLSEPSTAAALVASAEARARTFAMEGLAAAYCERYERLASSAVR